jgi:hypothetical protein
MPVFAILSVDRPLRPGGERVALVECEAGAGDFSLCTPPSAYLPRPFWSLMT